MISYIALYEKAHHITKSLTFKAADDFDLASEISDLDVMESKLSTLLDRIGMETNLRDLQYQMDAEAVGADVRDVSRRYFAASMSLRVDVGNPLLRLVLVNLLSNAIRYSPVGGAIDLIAQPAGDAVQIQVRDRGLGIPKEHQQLLFERFGRAHGAAFGGLGLGLAISKGLVERHGGKIWLESSGKPGEGTVFHVQLPLRTPPPET